MKIIVLGSSGLVGSRFVDLYPDRTSLVTPSHQDLDIGNREQIQTFFLSPKPDYIINFAAYTNVSEAEKERGNQDGLCWKTNVSAVENILLALDQKTTHFIQISTDMVFSGASSDPGPYSEHHQPETDSKSLTWYGYAKAQGEKLITGQLGNKATILRLIYPVRAHFTPKLDYLRKPLQLFKEGKLYPLFTDQQVSITFIDEACAALEKIIAGHLSGIFHVSSDLTTPYVLITTLLTKLGLSASGVGKSSLSEAINKGTLSPVRYPLFGGLETSQTEKVLGLKFRSWPEVLTELVNQGIGANPL